MTGKGCLIQRGSFGGTPASRACCDGTSLATPQVSVVAALVWSRRLNRTAAPLRMRSTRARRTRALPAAVRRVVSPGR